MQSEWRARIAITSRETAAYFRMSTGRKTPPGQSCTARAAGIAEWTPNRRASYDAADTTPRPSGVPPTITGLPLSSGRSRCSTAA